MLCPEVSKFCPPKIKTHFTQCEDFSFIKKSVTINNFYKTVVVTCPDEMQIPSDVHDKLIEDNDYYKIVDCSVTEFLVPTFIESFVKNGRLYCVTADRNCIIEDCVALTPDGILTLHLLEFNFQSLGLEGTKRNHGFYEIKIDLKNLKHIDRIKWSLKKLAKLSFFIKWEPNREDICPSSIAKYFNDRGISVSLCPLIVNQINPQVTEIPVLEDVPIEEMHEWVGMLAHDISMDEKQMYISSYGQPNSDNALKSNRICILVVKGLFTPTVLEEVCKNLREYVFSRVAENYWISCCFQSLNNSPWRWNISSPTMFQSHDCSCNIFITSKGYKIYSIGQLKYS